MGYRSEFDRCWSNGTNIRAEIRLLRLLKVIGVDTIRSVADDLLLVVRPRARVVTFPGYTALSVENSDFPYTPV